VDKEEDKVLDSLPSSLSNSAALQANKVDKIKQANKTKLANKIKQVNKIKLANKTKLDKIKQVNKTKLANKIKLDNKIKEQYKEEIMPDKCWTKLPMDLTWLEVLRISLDVEILETFLDVLADSSET
jgi:predicted Rossmann fold nucleotide-binding protein DprA/Smf involved in DNA uptake